jgi:hypothetical protein
MKINAKIILPAGIMYRIGCLSFIVIHSSLD